MAVRHVAAAFTSALYPYSRRVHTRRRTSSKWGFMVTSNWEPQLEPQLGRSNKRSH
jgi:hypothetical protein